MGQTNQIRPSKRIDFWDKYLKKVGIFLSDDDRRKNFLDRIRWIWGKIGLIFVLGYALTLLTLVALQGLIGEKNITIAFLLYLPRVIFLLPLLLVAPVALLTSWKSSAFLLFSSVIYLVFGMGFSIRSSSSPNGSKDKPGLTILSYNRGQHMNQSLQPFKNYIDPDVIALQESAGRAAGYAVAKGYEKFAYTDDIGEFTLLSRYPILEKELIVTDAGSPALPPAARFEIEYEGSRIAIYSVHVLSPRDTLLYYRRGAFLLGIIGLPGTPWAETRRKNQDYWDDRIAQAREVAQIVGKESLPTIVVGDFNAPSGGYIHRILRKNLIDAHTAAGSGFGYSFPGSTRNPLSRGGPWMRIDYVFCDEHWDPAWCITEKDRPSQHRAVAARFHLNTE